jgi:phage tail sheath protein FI
MILNQPIQYEWALPTNRKQNLAIGELAYKIPKKVMDVWQSLDGVGVNVITDIPSLGTTLWGNSTLFEVPPATYQALANLSTRYLFNAVEDVAYRCGVAITYQYNNLQAYNKFYAGVTPILDTMKNVGAIEDYKVKMSADINGLDQVNANSVLGKIYITPVGSIENITIDLIALPPGTDLNQFA